MNMFRLVKVRKTYLEKGIQRCLSVTA